MRSRAVHQHLDALEAKGLVSTRLRSFCGRVFRVAKITAAGRKVLP